MRAKEKAVLIRLASRIKTAYVSVLSAFSRDDTFL